MAKRDAIFPAGRQALYEINSYSAAIRSGDRCSFQGRSVAGKTAPRSPISLNRSNWPSRTSPRC